MSLLDEASEIAADKHRSRYSQCSVAKLTDEQRAEVEEALAQVDDVLTVEAIATAMLKWNLRKPIGAHTLRRHRSGKCQCEPG